MAGLFDKQADIYANARPTYLREWYQKLAALTPGQALAWDVGIGNSQAALGQDDGNDDDNEDYCWEDDDDEYDEDDRSDEDDEDHENDDSGDDEVDDVHSSHWPSLDSSMDNNKEDYDVDKEFEGEADSNSNRKDNEDEDDDNDEDKNEHEVLQSSRGLPPGCCSLGDNDENNEVNKEGKGDSDSDEDRMKPSKRKRGTMQKSKGK